MRPWGSEAAIVREYPNLFGAHARYLPPPGSPAMRGAWSSLDVAEVHVEDLLPTAEIADHVVSGRVAHNVDVRPILETAMRPTGFCARAHGRWPAPSPPWTRRGPPKRSTWPRAAQYRSLHRSHWATVVYWVCLGALSGQVFSGPPPRSHVAI